MVARLPDRLSFRQARNAVLVALLLGILVMSFEFYADIRRERASIAETVHQVVRIVQEPAAKASYDLDPALAAKVLEGLFSYGPIYRASVHAEFGLMAQDERPRTPGTEAPFLSELLFGRDMEVVVPLIFRPEGRQPVPVGEIRATVDMRLAAAAFFDRAGVVVLGGIVRNLLLGLALTALFHIMITKPILAVSGDMQRVSPADPSSIRVRCPPGHQSDEIGQLVGRMNEVLAAFDTAISQRDDYALALEDARCRAEEASRTKSQFLATISHELRTPLNAIIGFSELMASSAVAPESRGNYSSEILESGNRLLDLINDILELAEIDARRHQVVLEPLNVRLIAESCTRVVAGMARDRGLQFEVAVQADCPPLLADGRALRQVLVHVLSNAVKFTEPGGLVQLIASAEFDQVTFQVIDTGVGIEAELLSRVCEPFWQAEPFLSRRNEGAGLGLPLAKALTEKQGGALAIASQPGRGTTVTIVLPAATALQPKPVSAYAS